MPTAAAERLEMNAAPVFDRVYGSLKLLLREGELAPGSRLDPATLAGDLAASVTPVRDALHRLTGERLVDAAGDGFQVPMLSEPDLRDLYAWNHQLLLLALRSGDRLRDQGASANAGSGVAERIGAFFASLAAASDNCELLGAVRAVNERIHAIRLSEAIVLEDLESELAGLLTVAVRDLRVLLGRYHRRRLTAVPEILRARYRAAS